MPRTKEQEAAYQKIYQPKYRAERLLARMMSSKIDLRYAPRQVPYIIPEMEQCFFKGDIEPQVCSHFGCGKTLSLEEGRFGNKCINHSIKK